MIYTLQNNVNQFVVTGREKSILYASGVTPYYVLSLYNQQTLETKNVRLTILSSCSRYDLCQLTVSGTGESLSTAVISLLEQGFYDYYLYEQSVLNLSSFSASTLLEVGEFQLSGTNQTVLKPEFTNTTNIKVFNG